jgi:hypothetical protein
MNLNTNQPCLAGRSYELLNYSTKETRKPETNKEATPRLTNTNTTSKKKIKMTQKMTAELPPSECRRWIVGTGRSSGRHFSDDPACPRCAELNIPDTIPAVKERRAEEFSENTVQCLLFDGDHPKRCTSRSSLR